MGWFRSEEILDEDHELEVIASDSDDDSFTSQEARPAVPHGIIREAREKPAANEEAFCTVESFSLTAFADFSILERICRPLLNDKGSAEMKLSAKSDPDLGASEHCKLYRCRKRASLKIAGSVRPFKRRTDRVGGSFLRHDDRRSQVPHFLTLLKADR